jgi:hypothetical protein
MTKIAGSGSGQRHESSDPDPYQNVMDPQHCKIPYMWETGEVGAEGVARCKKGGMGREALASMGGGRGDEKQKNGGTGREAVASIKSSSLTGSEQGICGKIIPMFFLEKSGKFLPAHITLRKYSRKQNNFNLICKKKLRENSIPSEGLDPLLADRVQKLLLGRLVRRHPEVHRWGQLPDPLAERDAG